MLERAVGAVDLTDDDIARFRWCCLHFLHTSNAFIQAGRLIGTFDVVIASDLDTLPAAVVLGAEYGAVVVYDAHEFWPHGNIEFRPWEVDFWSAIEREMLSGTDIRATVSPQLALCMTEQYSYDFLSVPNCVSRYSVINSDPSAFDRKRGNGRLGFLFLGVFEAGRGIEDLIKGLGGCA